MFDRKAYYQRPDIKARVLAYHQTPGAKALAKASRQKPANLARSRDRVKLSLRQIRLEILESYGGKCECCGETNPAFLCIDHINGDGAKERKLRHGASFYYYLRKHRPTHVRVLCYNCNMARAFAGECPHQKAKEE